MILIFSESNDNTTSLVIDWLLEMNVHVLRINECDEVSDFCLTEDNCVLTIQQLATQKCIQLDTSTVTMVWFRKSGFHFSGWLKTQLGNTFLDRYNQNELNITRDYIYYILSLKPQLANIFNASLNKLYVNHLARKHGLLTPPFIISTHKNDLLRFLSTYQDQCITKAISETFFIAHDDSFIISYTEAVAATDLRNYSDQLKPTLLQSKIDKKYELRIFYLNGQCFSSAIFSQNDAQTQVDFRKYNYARPNRTVPFNLPESIAAKLKALMDELQLKTGSVDMIVSTDDQFYFLEINPVGQFGMVSGPCNYFLEQKVAQFLAGSASYPVL